jgi:hypothetical protein
MYLIDKTNNRIKKLEQKSFNELGFKERYHLQEWLANNPEALGEELLVIQKEFSGFLETNERLDLLAIDKVGNLVIIENKLDDTGRDVTWQAQKYASYCSSFSKEQIRNIYQLYIDKQGLKETATNKLSDFFNQDYDEIILNQINTQRIILVAANFRKEVTSTVLWLLNYKLHLQCFKATPFALADQLFLTLEQIIPTKGTEDFLISIADKTQDNISTQEGLKTIHILRTEFWNKLLPLLKGKTPIFQNISAGKDNWLNSGGTGISGLAYIFIITKTYARVLLNFEKKSKEENKQLYDELEKLKPEIENKFGNKLVWERLDDIVKSRVSFTLENVNILNKENWDKIIDFLSINMIKLEQSLRDPLAKIKKKFNATDETIE